MRLLGITWIAIAAAWKACAQSPPVFTADYYLMDPQRYLNKTTTLAVAFLTPRNEQRADHLRLFDAYTYNLGRSGGHISVVTTKSSAQRLITLCERVCSFLAGELKLRNCKALSCRKGAGTADITSLFPSAAFFYQYARARDSCDRGYRRHRKRPFSLST